MIGLGNLELERSREISVALGFLTKGDYSQVKRIVFVDSNSLEGVLYLEKKGYALKINRESGITLYEPTSEGWNFARDFYSDVRDLLSKQKRL